MRQELERALEAIESACKKIDELKAENKTLKEALAQPEQPKVRTGDCLLVGVCASEGHKIQVKQEPWRESASDYERGVIDGRQMQAQSSVDKAVNRMAQPEQEPVEWGVDWGKDGNSVSIIKRLADGNIEVLGWEYAPHPPQSTWVGLTMQDVKVIEDNAPSIQMAIFMAEATLKDKNA